MNPSRTLDLVLSLTDNASGKLRNVEGNLEQFEGKVGQATRFIEDNWVKIGAGAAALGGGIEVIARRQGELTNEFRDLAVVTERTEGEMRNLAVSLQNATFPMDDVVTLLEAGARQGLETNEELEKFANTWDMISDATGISAQTLADSSTALRRVKIEAENAEEAMDAFGFITKNTNIDVDEFMNVIERRGREIENLGLDIDQTAALMKVFQDETGESGRVLRQEFTRAVSDADGDLDGLLENLGMSREQFDTMTESVKGHSSVMEEMAENYAESKTLTQELTAFTERLTTQYGSVFEVLSSLVPFMIALGPILKTLIVLKGALAAAAGLVTLPILAIIAAIGALVAAGLWVWNNWQEISAGFLIIWDNIKQAFSSAIDFITARWQQFTDFFGSAWKSQTDFVVAVARVAYQGIKTVFIDPFVAAFNGVLNLLERARALFSSLTDRAGSVISSARDRASGVFSSARSFVTRSVNDAIISPRGDIITTHPDDYLIATKTPHSLGGGGGVTVIVNGDVSGEDLIDKVEHAIIGRLQHNVRLTSI